MNNGFSRRGFLKALGVGAGALAGTRLGGAGWLGNAWAAGEPTTLVMIHLNGGMNAIFASADSFNNTAFGVNNNFTVMGTGGPAIDNSLASRITGFARDHTAALGVRHGISDHGNAQRALYMAAGKSGPLELASQIGGTGAIKAALIGTNSLPNGQTPAPVNGISLQAIRDMGATVEAISGAQNAPNVVDRGGAAKGLTTAAAMSQTEVGRSPSSLSTVTNGYKAAVETLVKPVKPFSLEEFNTAYGLNGTNINSFPAKMAAAELMVRTDANFVFLDDGDWDTHGDRDGNRVRNQVNQRIAPAMGTFINRMINDDAMRAERNVMVLLVGDFSRSLPGSDHQANLSVTLVGKYVKTGTTGKTNANVGLPAGTPSVDGMWAQLAAAAKVPGSPFGANPHALAL